MKGILTLTRETHIKQVESPLAGSELAPREPRVIINVSPELSAEPLASYYFRRACGYGFVPACSTAPSAPRASRACTG